MTPTFTARRRGPANRTSTVSVSASTTARAAACAPRIALPPAPGTLLWAPVP